MINPSLFCFRGRASQKQYKMVYLKLEQALASASENVFFLFLIFVRFETSFFFCLYFICSPPSRFSWQEPSWERISRLAALPLRSRSPVEMGNLE